MFCFRAVILGLALLCVVKGASIDIVKPTNGQVVEAGDKTIWLELAVNDFDLLSGKGSIAVFVNGEYFKTTTEVSTGLENVEAGDVIIEVQLQDAENQVVAKSQVGIKTIINEPEHHQNTNANTAVYVPLEGDTMPLGSLVLLSPKQGQFVALGSALPIKFRLVNVPNAQISAVHIIANDAHEIFVFQGESEGEISLPALNNAGVLKITARLGGHPNHVAMGMEASAVVTVGDAQQMQDEQDNKFVKEIIEEEAVDGNWILAAGSDEPDDYYHTFLASLRYVKSDANVVLFVPKVSPKLASLAKEFRANLVVYDAQHAPVACQGEKTSGVGCFRYFLFKRFLMDKIAEISTSRIFITDVDTLFQSDPFVALSDRGEPIVYFGVSNSFVIEDDDDHSHYLSDHCVLYDMNTLNTVGSKPIAQGPLMLGNFDAVLTHVDALGEELVNSLSKTCKKYADIPAREFVSTCHHQGIHNALVHNIKDIGHPSVLLSSEQSPVFATFKWDTLRMNNKFQVLVPSQDESENQVAAVVVGGHNFDDLVAALSGKDPVAKPDEHGIRKCQRNK